MTKCLLTFGDSWPAGSELDARCNDQRFPELVARALGLGSINLAEPATSIDHAVLNLIQRTDLADSMVLFCVTAKERGMYFDGGQRVELHPQHTQLPSVSYYSYLYSDKLGEYNRIKNVLLVQEICNRLNVPVRFVCNWNHPPQHALIDPDLFYPQSLVEILGIANFEDDSSFYSTRGCSPYINPNLGHPNLAGHRLIADTLTAWIQSTIK
jgi:hypothetical protein